jgi:hypothetical protein
VPFARASGEASKEDGIMITYTEGMRAPYALMALAEADGNVAKAIKKAVMRMAARLEIVKVGEDATAYNLVTPTGGFIDGWKLSGTKVTHLYRYAIPADAALDFSHYCFAQYGIEATWRHLPDGRVEYLFYATREQAKIVHEYIIEHSLVQEGGEVL